MRDKVYRCEGNILKRCYQTSDVHVLGGELYELFAALGRKIHATQHTRYSCEIRCEKPSTAPSRAPSSICAVEIFDSVVGNMRLVPELQQSHNA